MSCNNSAFPIKVWSLWATRPPCNSPLGAIFEILPPKKNATILVKAERSAQAIPSEAQFQNFVWYNRG